MLNEAFGDSFSQRKNYLTEVDARIKILFVVLAIILIVSSRHFYVPLIAFFLSLVSILSIKIPPKIILLRLASPLSIAGTIFIIQVFFYGITPVVELNILGWQLLGYKEGLLRGSLIMAKVIGATSLVIFLSITTPLNKLLNAARWFKVSNTWIEIAAFSYRYIFILLEDAMTIRDAQEVRLGYSSLVRGLRSFGELAGATVIRAYDRSAGAYEAMVLRGYNGTMRNIVWEEKFRIKDVIAGSIFIIILASLLILSILHN